MNDKNRKMECLEGELILHGILVDLRKALEEPIKKISWPLGAMLPERTPDGEVREGYRNTEINWKAKAHKDVGFSDSGKLFVCFYNHYELCGFAHGFHGHFMLPYFFQWFF